MGSDRKREQFTQDRFRRKHAPTGAPPTRDIWTLAEEAKKEVDSWPEWKRRAADQALVSQPTGAPRVLWCPQCGERIAVDEDGCCTECGATHIDASVVAAIRGEPTGAPEAPHTRWLDDKRPAVVKAFHALHDIDVIDMADGDDDELSDVATILHTLYNEAAGDPTAGAPEADPYEQAGYADHREGLAFPEPPAAEPPTGEPDATEARPSLHDAALAAVSRCVVCGTRVPVQYDRCRNGECCTCDVDDVAGGRCRRCGEPAPDATEGPAGARERETLRALLERCEPWLRGHLAYAYDTAALGGLLTEIAAALHQKGADT